MGAYRFPYMNKDLQTSLRKTETIFTPPPPRSCPEFLAKDHGLMTSQATVKELLGYKQEGKLRESEELKRIVLISNNYVINE